MTSVEEKTNFRGSPEFKETVWEQLEEFKADKREMQHRKANLIFQRLEESSATEPAECLEEDKEEVENITRNLGVQDTSIKEVMRINPAQGWLASSYHHRPRLLKEPYNQKHRYGMF